MIIDSLENAERYYTIHPLFAEAFEYLKTQDLNAVTDEKFDITDGIKGLMSSKTGKTAAESLEKFECHEKNIDIQFCISGTETIGWKPKAKCQKVKEAYNAEKDIAFYDEMPDMYFQLTNNQFAVFFPEDVHAPMIGEGMIKKIILKIRIQ